MDKRFLESSEFYNARYHNFSTLLILPTTCLVVAVLLFSFLGKKEVTIDGIGTTTTTQTVPTIQATANSAIKNNYLSEGKYVHQGQTLLVYNNVLNHNKLSLYETQAQKFTQQITALDTLKSGITNNTDSFAENDTFGYRQLLQSYLKQWQVYQTENQMLTQKSASTQQKQASLTQIEQQVVERNSANLTAYQALYQAVNNDNGYDKKAKYSYIYQEYKNKLASATDNTDKSGIKEDYLTNIQQEIDTLQDTVASAKAQVEELKEFDDTNYSVAINQQKMQTLQDDQMNAAVQDQVKAKQNLQEIKTSIANLKTDNKKYKIKAPKTGVIHTTEQYQGAKYVGNGASLAEIYPVLRQQKYLRIKSYVPTTDISSVKKGQQLRFKVTRNVPKPVLLTGKIKQISVSPITINHGNYYLVTATAKINPKQKKLLKYGMEGTTSVITGKETFFNYYKNKLLNKE